MDNNITNKPANEIAVGDEIWSAGQSCTWTVRRIDVSRSGWITITHGGGWIGPTPPNGPVKVWVD